jgi:hypothetical protein
MSDLRPNSIGHETDSTDVRWVALTGFGLAVGVGIVFFLVYGIFQYLAHHQIIITPASPLAETDRQQFPVIPRIEEHPANELKELHAHEDQVLSTYGWVDKQAGVVRIPISNAMELQLKRGFTTRKEATTK